ncbi:MULTISPECIES: hypothetical protein [Streptomyces]|nr:MULTISPECIES: hypothetical protein [Streptomyces]AZK97467.1 hypothetical protein B7R87_28955 [Streptomyces tsukubensis]MYS68265.1 hypothetical protein [Streptomyces sp. SID5473]TAI45075.1 hypothetical protein EWI31_07400 [Streptomyces tsukubensis]
MRRTLSVLAVIAAAVAAAVLPAAAASPTPVRAPMSCQNPHFCISLEDIIEYLEDGWTPAQIEALNRPRLTQQLINVCLKAGSYRPLHILHGHEWDPKGALGLYLHREGCTTPIPWP